MTVEIDRTIAIATLSDWLKTLGEKSNLTKHKCGSNVDQIRHLSDLSMFSGRTNVIFVSRTNRIMMHLHSR